MRTEPSFSAEPDVDLLADHTKLNAATVTESELLSDYRQRYGLSIDPFIDDPHFPFYQGAQRRQILEQVLHLCQFSYNLIVVTGDYGVGKTRMAQALIDSLDDADDICFVEGQITSDMSSVFSEVLDQFELADKAEFAEFCVKKSEQDGLVVLIVDNAHHLTDEVISEIVNLLEENFESRLHVVMFTEPHLVDRLNTVNAPDIILTDFFLEKFSLAEAVDYLNFRMEMADYLGPEIFVEAKVEPWWRQAQGQLLTLHDFAQQKLLETVSVSRSSQVSKRNMLVPHIVGTSVLVGALLFIYLYFGGESKEQVETKITESVPIPQQSESTDVGSQSNTQSSSIAASIETAITASTEINPGQSQASQSMQLNNSSAASENAQVSQEIRQSVVPLAQTNDEFHREVVKSQSKTAISSAVKANISSVASSKSKVVTKAKVESEKEVTRTPSGLSAQEKTILSWDESEFTLQIVGLSNEKSALEFIAAQSNKKDLFLFRSLRQGKDWFVVVTGHYPNSAKARQAVQSLPVSQQKATPWPRDLKTIHREIVQR